MYLKQLCEKWVSGFSSSSAFFHLPFLLCWFAVEIYFLQVQNFEVFFILFFSGLKQHLELIICFSQILPKCNFFYLSFVTLIDLMFFLLLLLSFSVVLKYISSCDILCLLFRSYYFFASFSLIGILSVLIIEFKLFVLSSISVALILVVCPFFLMWSLF